MNPGAEPGSVLSGAGTARPHSAHVPLRSPNRLPLVSQGTAGANGVRLRGQTATADRPAHNDVLPMRLVIAGNFDHLPELVEAPDVVFGK